MTKSEAATARSVRKLARSSRQRPFAFFQNLPKREPQAIPATEILRQACEVLAVLLAHPPQGRFPVREPIDRARRMRINVRFQNNRRYVPRPPGSPPHIQRRERGEGFFGLFRWPYLGLNAHPIRAAEVGIFRLQTLLVEPHSGRAGLRPEVERAALFREVIPVPGLPAHDAPRLLHLNAWP